MAAEIRILSGARKGEKIVLDGTEFRAGADTRCDVYFDPRSDPPAKNRSVSLWLTSDGWFIRSTGVGEVLLNQTPIVGEAQLRSGDLVRLSDRGPDFSISLSRRASNGGHEATALAHPTETEPEARRRAASAHRAGIPDGSGEGKLTERPSASTPGSAQSPWNRIVWTGATAASTILLFVGVWYLGFRGHSAAPGAPTSEASLELEAVATQTAAEGSEFTLRLHVRVTGGVQGRPAFILIGKTPDGVKVDPQTGVFTWAPIEEQGPGQYTFHIRASLDGSETLTAETMFQVNVKEVNLPPSIRPIDEKQIDAGKELIFPVAADDPDVPANKLVFRLSDNSEWISVDPISGVVRCLPPAVADGRFEATAHVSDDGDPPLEDQAVIRIDVHGDPWSRVQHELRESLFLVQVMRSGRDGDVSWPFSTCSAVNDHTLLTSAREVLQLVELQDRGYQISVVNPVTGFKTAVRSLRVSKEFNDLSDRPGDWIFVNPGLIEAEEALPKAMPLATPEELRNLKEGLPVACFGFSHDGSKITSFNIFQPELVPGKVYLMSSLPGLKENGQVLELKGRIMENMYGSPILNQRGAIVAVYGEAAPRKSVGVKDLHYATVLDLPLLQSWLHGRDEGNWVKPRLPRATSRDQRPSSNRVN
ncbi:MAG: hypothetical protein A2V70_00275 [Planctomycetes bacterium RBG_13_63_9]|nr:MAG: hypothetical protein A2V70_00275 [Planctomycetes bacterium RBG_13_63_9]